MATPRKAATPRKPVPTSAPARVLRAESKSSKSASSDLLPFITMISTHVIPFGNRWIVRSSTASRASKIFSNASEALDYARQKAIAGGTELFVHSKEGGIVSHDSYARSPEVTRIKARA